MCLLRNKSHCVPWNLLPAKCVEDYNLSEVFINPIQFSNVDAVVPVECVLQPVVEAGQPLEPS